MIWRIHPTNIVVLKISHRVLFYVSAWHLACYWSVRPGTKTSCLLHLCLFDLRLHDLFVFALFTTWKLSVFGVYLVWMRENRDQKKSECGHFSRSGSFKMLFEHKSFSFHLRNKIFRWFIGSILQRFVPVLFFKDTRRSLVC